MKNRKPFFIAGMVAGGLLTLGPVWGLLGTVFGMMHAFSTLNNNGIADPTTLSNHIGTTLMSTTMGILMFPVGVTMLVISVLLYLKAQKPTPPPIP